MRDRPPQRNHPTSFYTMLKKNSNKVSSARFPIFCLNAQDDVPGELLSGIHLLCLYSIDDISTKKSCLSGCLLKTDSYVPQPLE